MIKRISILLWSGLVPSSLFASDVVNAEITNPLSSPDLMTLLGKLIEAILQVMVPVLVVYLIWIGFLFVKAQGNPGKIQEARSALWNALIGATIILGTFVIAQLLQTTVDQVVKPKKTTVIVEYHA